jgi:hypothetical protein
MQGGKMLHCASPFLLARHSMKAMTALAAYKMKLMNPQATTASQVLYMQREQPAATRSV